MSSPCTILKDLLAQHNKFLTQAKQRIDDDWNSCNNKQHKAVITLLSRRLEAHQEWLQKAIATKQVAENDIQWGAISVTRQSRHDRPPVLTINGPAAQDAHSVTVESGAEAEEIEAQIRQYNKLIKALARAYPQQQAIVAHLKTSCAFEEEHRSQASDDRARIALLKHYNDTRDVAQQLIGVIADNRGVPVRSLYADKSFGVGPED